jgi:threonine dehydratase
MTITIADISSKTGALLNQAFYSEGGVVKTPLLHSPALSELSGCNLYLKCENLQTTGSFKIRGATSAILNLPAGEKEVVTASSGNHGAATATAAKAHGISVSIYVPEAINEVKENKIISAGATLVKIPGPGDNAEAEAARVAAERELSYISPYNHADIVAGQGTLGAEILDQLPEVNAIFASVGGGGLISGIGCHLHTHKPGTEIVGCWPGNSTAMLQCMRAGKVIEVSEENTLSDGTAGGVEQGSLTLNLCEDVISSTTTVSEWEIARAMALVHQHHDFIVEGAAGVALAGLLQNPDAYKGRNVVIVLCGQNIATEKFEFAMDLAASENPNS